MKIYTIGLFSNSSLIEIVDIVADNKVQAMNLLLKDIDLDELCVDEIKIN